MTAKSTPTRPSAEEVLAAAPPVRHEPGARDRIRAAHAAVGRRIAALDDDPTGSQTVHDVSVVTVFEDAEYAAGLAEPGSTCFVLTNTRSLPEDAAVELTTRVAGSLFTLGRPWAHPSRSSAAAIPPSAATSSPRCRPSTPPAAGSPAPDSTGAAGARLLRGRPVHRR